MQRPPPFAALRALEAACRHRSYTAAAAELNVTHSAVSQAVRRLEEEVGAKLFYRKGSAMEPAAASLALAQAYAEASRSVGKALRSVAEGLPNTVTIRAPGDIGRHWLAPMLPQLAERFPGLSLRFRGEDSSDPDVDIALTPAAAPPGDGIRVADYRLAAYASPELARRIGLRTAADMLKAPLLIEGDGSDWSAWFRAAAVAQPFPPRGLHFEERSGLALDSALRGAGVALCDSLSVADALQRGDLVRICPDVEIDRCALYAIASRHSGRGELLAEIAGWLATSAVRLPARDEPVASPLHVVSG